MTPSIESQAKSAAADVLAEFIDLSLLDPQNSEQLPSIEHVWGCCRISHGFRPDDSQEADLPLVMPPEFPALYTKALTDLLAARKPA